MAGKKYKKAVESYDRTRRYTVAEACQILTGKAKISINSKPYLNLVGKMLSKYPKLQIEMAGHTDNVGSPASNEKLSQDRAEEILEGIQRVLQGEIFVSEELQ